MGNSWLDDEAVAMLVGTYAGPLIAPVYQAYSKARTLTSAIVRNSTTSRGRPLLARVVATLARLSPEQRLAARYEIRPMYETLVFAHDEFIKVFRDAATARSARLRHHQAFDLLHPHNDSGLLGDTQDDTIRINRELSAARFALYPSTTRSHHCAPSATQWAIVVHHLVNVYGRRTGAGARPLATLEQLVNDFEEADLSRAEIYDDDVSFDVQLAGVRWSHETRWPPEHFERIRAASLPLSGDRFEIQRPSR